MRVQRCHVEVTSDEDQEQGLRDLLERLSMEDINLKNMVEVGTYLGGSALIFSDYFDMVYCVDNWPDEKIFEEFKKNVENNKSIWWWDTLDRR